MKLNLGCGNKQREGFIGVDRYPCEAANVLCDMAQGLPFCDNSITAVSMDNVIEHVLDIPALMQEIVRVATDGALVTVITPHFSALASWRDPTHVHHLSYFSFDYFARPAAQHYVGGGLHVVRRQLSFGGGLLGLTGRLIFWWSPETYEKKFCFMFRASTLRFELAVRK